MCHGIAVGTFPKATELSDTLAGEIDTIISLTSVEETTGDGPQQEVVS